jgi:hypothetical protein
MFSEAPRRSVAPRNTVNFMFSIVADDIVLAFIRSRTLSVAEVVVTVTSMPSDT